MSTRSLPTNFTTMGHVTLLAFTSISESPFTSTVRELSAMLPNPSLMQTPMVMSPHISKSASNLNLPIIVFSLLSCHLASIVGKDSARRGKYKMKVEVFHFYFRAATFLFKMTIPNCTTETVFYAEPRRGSTSFLPTLRRALARRMWGQGLGSVPEYFLRGYAKSRRCSTTAARFSLKAIVRALEHLRRSGSILHRKPQVQSAIALLNLGIKIVEPLRGSNPMQKVFGVPMQISRVPKR